MIDYDSELQLHNEQFRAAADIRAGDRVLDIGCGTGVEERRVAAALAPAAFSLADRSAVHGILTVAGFTQIEFRDKSTRDAE